LARETRHEGGVLPEGKRVEQRKGEKGVKKEDGHSISERQKGYLPLQEELGWERTGRNAQKIFTKIGRQ